MSHSVLTHAQPLPSCPPNHYCGTPSTSVSASQGGPAPAAGRQPVRLRGVRRLRARAGDLALGALHHRRPDGTYCGCVGVVGRTIYPVIDDSYVCFCAPGRVRRVRKSRHFVVCAVFVVSRLMSGVFGIDGVLVVFALKAF